MVILMFDAFGRRPNAGPNAVRVRLLDRGSR
jgi:acid phosphatase family membrane protein YuiD